MLVAEKKRMKMTPEERKSKHKIYMRDYYRKMRLKNPEGYKKRQNKCVMRKRIRRQLGLIKKDSRKSRTWEYRNAIINYLIERDGINCGFCGKPVTEDDVCIDHIIPVGLGGQSILSNFRVAHKYCNYKGGFEVRKQLHGY